MESSSSSFMDPRFGGEEENDDGNRSSLWETMSAIMPNVNTTKSVWEIPKLHSDIRDSDDDYHGQNSQNSLSRHSGSSGTTHRGENW